ncbi:YbaN family protein [Streptococcus saliviloxodontae]|uniref:Uncharacterized membrane protein YbaN (DUF454 family) n=1 Tax=Streptococcus saliviloxodontae TaxID=1349416 RepID=A0ABS2PJA7_9STRE|nr:DUF454 family protein [Streptococcus saliviloxodontae]MBM7635514.1 uncharacterized membrane protein YbaN (DUF454 family) [Streptococcus saliviloxodontae]
MKKIFLITVGFVSLFLGIIGIVVPLLPTTPFLLLAGSCFASSSQKFDRWLKQTKVYDFYVGDYLETRSIARSKKKKILLQVYLLMGISIFFAPLLPIKVMLAVMTLFFSFVLFFKVPDKEE